ncbi:MAG: hypothetical protein DMG60_09560, partial [Acidobacteria bacterium]
RADELPRTTLATPFFAKIAQLTLGFRSVTLTKFLAFPEFRGSTRLVDGETNSLSLLAIAGWRSSLRKFPDHSLIVPCPAAKFGEFGQNSITSAFLQYSLIKSLINSLLIAVPRPNSEITGYC